ncbi:MAG: hypothetical protein HFI34_10495 [Lachnospiraceae bacterium]|nr:hypothetical protein [Lachnospiraceae bacterium]
MLKFCGVLLILLSGSGMGFRAAYNMRLRLEQLKQLKKAFLLLKGEIRYSHQTINVALLSVADKMEGPVSNIFGDTAEQLDKYDGRLMNDIWSETLKEYREELMLSNRQMNFLEDIGNTLGYLDKEMQMNNFDLHLEQLNQEIEEEERNMKDSTRLYRCLGVMGSILVTLILV